MEDHRINALQYMTNRYIDNVWKHIGIHLFAAGWVLSSPQLQVLLGKSIWIKLGLTCMFLVMQCIHSFVNLPIYHQIRDLSKELETQVDANLSKFYGVSRRRFYLNEFLIASIAVFAVTFVWVLPKL